MCRGRLVLMKQGMEVCGVQLVPTQGEAGDATIKIQVDENTSYDDRNAVLRLSYGNSTKNIFVNQTTG